MKTDKGSQGSENASWVPQSLAETSVAIWGVGLMGGSLAMSLHGKTAFLYGIDTDQGICHQPKAIQLFDRISTNPAELLPKADLIVICAPLGLIPALLKQIPSFHPGHAVVLDIGSTKSTILPVMEELPERFIPIGGHPMSGKEFCTFLNATSDLFEGGSFALLPLPRTTRAASLLAEQLVKAIGAHPVWLDPIKHDRWASAISTLPYLAAIGLSAVTPLEAAPLVGPGYKSTTRLAGESIDMMIHTLTNNRENVLKDLKQIQAKLNQIEIELDQENYPGLRSLFEEGKARHSDILDAFSQGGK